MSNSNSSSSADNVNIVEDFPGYEAPKEKSLDAIINADAEDEALKKYKAALLGDAANNAEKIIVDAANPKNVIVARLALVVDGRPDVVLELQGRDLKDIRKEAFVIKEGVQFRIRIDFYVQREIVSGLKYVQKTSRMAVTVDKMTHMVGSYAPKKELQSYTTPVEDAPQGVTGRGSYNVTSLFTDDDKIEYLKWNWHIEVKKDW